MIPLSTITDILAAGREFDSQREGPPRHLEISPFGASRIVEVRWTNGLSDDVHVSTAIGIPSSALTSLLYNLRFGCKLDAEDRQYDEKGYE